MAYRTLFDPAQLSASALHHEHEVLSFPYSPKVWFSYVKHIGSKDSSVAPSFAIAVFERAVAALPTSYKIWVQYINFLLHGFAASNSENDAMEHTTSVHLRAARLLPHCPFLWESTLSWIVQQALWTRARPIIDEAVRSLPVTLHPRFWRFVLKTLNDAQFLELKAHVLCRANMLLPDCNVTVDLFRTLRNIGKVDEAVSILSGVLRNAEWGGDTRRELWMELIDVVARHPRSCTSVDIVALVRGAIQKTEAEHGDLWVSLAEIHTRRGQFNEARAVYEEALSLVMTVRDFAVVFDSYAKFLETLITESLNDSSDSESSDEDDSVEDTEVDVLNGDALTGNRAPKASNVESDSNLNNLFRLEPLMKALEELTSKRPLLLSDVWLRQNPHNVHEWHKRATILQEAGDSAGAVRAYTESVRTVDPWRATHGRPHTLWLAFAGLYENAGDPESARKVFDKAVSDPEKFKTSDDLATIWCEYAEMELRLGSLDRACEVLKHATTMPIGFEKRKFLNSRPKPVHRKSNTEAALAGAGQIKILHEYDTSSPAWLAWKSLRVWAFYADLRESEGIVQDALQIHERMLDLNIATVQTLMNAVSFLESKRLFEQAFRLLDRATSIFSWPELMTVWVVYLKKFVRRYGSKKVERARDLFEYAIKEVSAMKGAKSDLYPGRFLRTLYLMYIDFEEQFGLARRSMLLYQRAAQSAAKEYQAGIYRLYVVKACEFFGVTRAREVYADAIESLAKREDLIEFSRRFALMETRMGEIDRARAIYAHGAHIADPRGGLACAAYWSSWNSFELEHGTEDTFRDMLRVKRTVQMQNAGIHLLTSVAAGAGTVEAAAAAASANKVASAAREVADGGRSSRELSSGQASHEIQARTILQNKLDEADKPRSLGNAEEIPLQLSSDDDEDEFDKRESSATDQEHESDDTKTADECGHKNGTFIEHIDGNDQKKRTDVEISQRPIPEAIKVLVPGTDGQTATVGEADTGNVVNKSNGDKAQVILGAKERLKRRRNNL